MQLTAQTVVASRDELAPKGEKVALKTTKTK